MLAKNLKEWHKVICERENHFCRVCKKDFNHDHYFDENGVNQYLTGHHYPHTQKSRPDLVLDVSNGVPLCLDCHTKAHKGLVEIPEADFEATEDIPKSKTATQTIDHVLPSGVGIRLRGYEKLCKCKKYVVLEAIDLCMRCEKRTAPILKSSQKKK